MRTRFLLLILALSGSIFSARADVIFSGSVGLGNAPVPPQFDDGICAQTGQGEGVVNVSCSADGGGFYSRVSGSGDAFGGSLTLDASAPGSADPLVFSVALGSAELQLNELYVLTGGTGTGVVSFDLTPVVWGSPHAPELSCSLSVDGVEQQSCISGPYLTYSETVQYNVPFLVDFQLQMNGVADGMSEGDGFLGQLEYSVSAPGLELVPTPEPSSMLLVGSGLLGIVGSARRRLKMEPR